jgi:hypothetical protein
MRNMHILFAAAVLIGLAGVSHAAPAANSPPPSSTSSTKGNGADTSSETARPGVRRPQQQQPFYCFGDAACEREMARQGRPVADQGKRQRDPNEGPFIDGIPGQTDVPGFSDTPVPVVPGK